MKEIILQINGQEIRAQEGQTILEVALAHGMDIPHLCYDPRLSPTGAVAVCCRNRGAARPAYGLHAAG